MSQRLNEYFASEASEYLEQLEVLLGRPGVPDSDALLRLSTGVRGSAKMAGADIVASVAERLERAVRSLHSTGAPWSEELCDASQHTVVDLRALVHALDDWGEDEDKRAENAISRWDRLEVSEAGVSRKAVSVSALFYEDGGPNLVEGVDELPVVSVDTLLFRGQGALRQALSLRHDIEQAISNGGDGGQLLADLLDELFDLLELGLSRELPEA